MQALEEELQHPTGAPVVSAPLLLMSGLLISKECGLMLEIKHIKGLRCVSRRRYNSLSLILLQGAIVLPKSYKL